MTNRGARVEDMIEEAAATTTDPRAAAALAVLAGEDAASVSRRLDVPAALVVRWTQQFVDAGSAALRGEQIGDPAHRDRFLALVSHELRTPLAVIRGWADTLQTVPGALHDPDLIAAGMSAIAGHTARLTRLSGDLIDSAAVTLGRLQLELSDLDLDVLVTDVAGSFEGDRISVETTDVRIRADRDRVGQIVTNLLHDALSRTNAALRVVLDADSTWTTIRVLVPVTPPPFEEMHALFEPFDAGTGDAHTGLSLYVCRALAVAHGGQCGVDAHECLEFWVRLPVRGPHGPLQV